MRKLAHAVDALKPKVARSDRLVALANAQRAWLDQVVAKTGRTLSEIARDGDINPSTLTRFRNNTHHAGTLSAPTMAAVSAVTGIPLPQEVSAAAPTARAGFAEGEAALWEAEDTHDPVAAAIAAMTGNLLHKVAWQLRSEALLHESYRPGDILIVNLNAAPKPGDIVLVQLYDWRNRAGTETVFRFYEPPFLIASGPVEAAKKPRLINTDEVGIKGVVEAMLRPAVPRL
jgi:transposase-like protein